MRLNIFDQTEYHGYYHQLPDLSFKSLFWFWALLSVWKLDLC